MISIQNTLTMKQICAFLWTIMLFMGSCGSPEPSTPPPAPVVTTPVVTAPTTYPPIPGDVVQTLYETCDHIDYIFYEWGFSVNVTTFANTRRNLTQLGATSPPQLNCKTSIGRMTLLAQGNILLEGEIYFQPGVCNYFILYENKKPKYSVQMTQEGLNFFNDLYKRTQKG